MKKNDVIISIAERYDEVEEWADVSVISLTGKVLDKDIIKSCGSHRLVREDFDESNQGWFCIPSISLRKRLLSRKKYTDEKIEINQKYILRLMVENQYKDIYNVIKVISV